MAWPSRTGWQNQTGTAVMRAWTVDADDIRVAEDFDQKLLHRTPDIDAFLSPDGDERCMVIGTKGLGKTLLLKAKRIQCQSTGQTLCLPAGNLLDKPIGDKIFGREAISFFAASPLPWAKVWLAAIAMATLKQAGLTQGLKVNASLAGLIADTGLHSVIDHFVRLLDFSPSELQRSAAEVDGHLVPRLRQVRSAMAFFIDGIDEYFNKHLEERFAQPSVTGELAPQIWHFSQLGLFEVAYQLRRINHHLRVYAAIRKEAYAALPRRTAMAQQYRGSAVDIAYPASGLREIFINNIRLLKPDRLVLPGKLRSQPLLAFLGRATVTDPVTREEEDVFDHLCRHTLLRPGESAADPSLGLPRAAHYLVHPVLSDTVAALNPGFVLRSDGLNIIGHDRPWQDPGLSKRPASQRSCCVLKADVHAFGRWMRAGKDGPVRKALEDAVARWAPASSIAETGSGDAVLIAEDDPLALARTARQLLDEVYHVPGQPRLRIALHHGDVLTRVRDADQRETIVGGQAILHASRVEPLVEPGQIWVTEEFRQQFALRPSLWRTVPLLAQGGEERFNARKPGSSEADLWVQLHRLAF